MMEYGLLIGVVFGSVFVYISDKLKETKRDKKFQKIDDKNFIINGKFVSMESDDLISRMEQETEDSKHFRHYEQSILDWDRTMITEEYFKTKQAILKYPEIKDVVTAEKIEGVTVKYNKYLNKVKKLDLGIYMLTKEEFLIKEENLFLCGHFSIKFNSSPLPFYMIHNEEVAKYLNGNMREKMAAEFKEKWY